MHAAGAKRASTDKAMTRERERAGGRESPADTILFPCISPAPGSRTGRGTSSKTIHRSRRVATHANFSERKRERKRKGALLTMRRFSAVVRFVIEIRQNVFRSIRRTRISDKFDRVARRNSFGRCTRDRVILVSYRRGLPEYRNTRHDVTRTMGYSNLRHNWDQFKFFQSLRAQREVGITY